MYDRFTSDRWLTTDINLVPVMPPPHLTSYLLEVDTNHCAYHSVTEPD